MVAHYQLCPLSIVGSQSRRNQQQITWRWCLDTDQGRIKTQQTLGLMQVSYNKHGTVNALILHTTAPFLRAKAATAFSAS